MIASAAPHLDLLRTLVALLGGYLVGSLPVSAWVGAAAGVDVRREGERNPGAANVWKLAGPGWGLLALAGDLAKGILPVAIGVVTFSWWTGWAAGIGALAGAVWPALGRVAGGRGVAALAGACIALAPPVALAGILLTLLVLAAARVTGRNGRVAAITVGFATYPFLFLVAQPDLVRLAGIGLLYLVAAARYTVTAH